MIALPKTITTQQAQAAARWVRGNEWLNSMPNWLSYAVHHNTVLNVCDELETMALTAWCGETPTDEEAEAHADWWMTVSEEDAKGVMERIAFGVLA